MVARYGLPSVFVTISPDDIHSPLSLRMSFPSADNIIFPADPGGFLEALMAQQTTFGKIPLDKQCLAAIAAGNPVACAEIFQRLLEAVSLHLFGIRLSHGYKKTTPLGTFGGGIFGDVIAEYAVVEGQDRGTLHAHLCLWTSLSPRVLQSVAAYFCS